MAMTLVSTVTVSTTGISQVDFNSIPQTGKDLLLVASARIVSNTGNQWSDAGIQFNGTGSGYSERYLYGNGSGVVSAAGSSMSFIPFRIGNSLNTTNTFGNGAIYIANYISTNAKAYSIDQVTENNGTNALQMITAGSSSNTAAITSLSFFSAEFVVGTSVSLYIIS